MERRISWNLAVLMAQRGITTATELSQRLAEQGRDITPTHAARIVRKIPRRLDTELLQGLLNVLDCSANELLGLVPTKTGGAVSQVAAPSQASPAADATNAETESGPSTMDICPGPAKAATTDADPATVTGNRNRHAGDLSVRNARTCSKIPETPLF